ncbi:MAG TPA: hypothetical protein VGL61_23580 [Kofleriaceae bacterium]|jgi:hypothetical protein
MRALVATVLMLFAISARAEVIEIHDYVPPKVLPKPSRSWNPNRLPPYSDAAILQDAWVRSWLLLDIDAHGKVARFKFLRRPGYDLEPIAAREVWNLTFDPARDNTNRPVGTLIVWRIEWPSAGWMLDRFGTYLVWPPKNADNGVSPVEDVPCASRGSLDLESIHPVFRDCSQPDLRRVNVEPWVTRPGS